MGEMGLECTADRGRWQLGLELIAASTNNNSNLGISRYRSTTTTAANTNSSRSSRSSNVVLPYSLSSILCIVSNDNVRDHFSNLFLELRRNQEVGGFERPQLSASPRDEQWKDLIFDHPLERQLVVFGDLERRQLWSEVVEDGQ